MSINYKKVNDIPELTELTGIEKIIVNDNGKARQVSAELIGGGAEATVFYYENMGPLDAASEPASGLYDGSGTEVSVDVVFEALENGIVKVKPMGSYGLGSLVISYERYDEFSGVIYFATGDWIQSFNIGEIMES